MKQTQKTATESDHIQRARKKLQKMMDDESKLFSPEKLQQIGEVMRQWIQRYAGERTPLKEKNIGLFDSNQHTAKTSSAYVQQLREQIKTGNLSSLSTEGSTEEVSIPSLKGRFSTAQPGSSEIKKD